MTSNETRYVVLNCNGDVIRHNLDRDDACNQILTDDGQEWEVRPDSPEGHTLWSRKQVGNVSWHPTAVYSAYDDYGTAYDDIMEKVISSNWDRQCYAMPMTEHVQSQSDIFREDILGALDIAAQSITGDPRAIGASDQDLSALFKVLDHLLDGIANRISSPKA